MPRLFEILGENSKKDLREKTEADRTPPRAHTKSARKQTSQKHSSGAPLYVPDFVAIDCETTGLLFKKDRIIEIGAMKFHRGKPGETFSTFINPGIPIPSEITGLTSIQDSDVASAPSFSEKADELLTFLGSYPLCGHQIDFDVNFINTELKRSQKGRLENQTIDTAVIARLVVPNLASYALSQLAQHLQIPLENAHRALDDSIATGHCAAVLIPKLAEIPSNTRQIMGKFAPASMLKSILLNSVDRNTGKRAEFHKPAPQITGRLTFPEEPLEIEEKQIEEIFSEKGMLSGKMESYTMRGDQVQMALSVTHTLNSRDYLTVEAGTGIGKSLAYLVPAALWAHQNDCRILISTHTRNLQDQLTTKELPLVKEMVGESFRFSVLKGRANYLCRNRWSRLLLGRLGNLSPRERFGTLPLIRWAEKTETGDIEEQNLFNRKWFSKVWNLISADSHDCLHRRCPWYNECYLQQARQKALTSHVVVINHALFFSEICSESSFLGMRGPIIFDEAHHLESCGHRYLCVELDSNRMARYIESCEALIKSMTYNKNPIKDNTQIIKQLKKEVRHIRKRSEEFFAECVQWARDKEAVVNKGIFQAALQDAPFAASSGKAGLEIAIDEIQSQLISSLRQWEAESKENELTNDIRACSEQTSQCKADLSYLTAGMTEGHVFWLEGSLEKGWAKFCGVPIDIGTMLSEIWAVSTFGAIFTSATLSISGSLDFFKKKTGLDSLPLRRLQCEMYDGPFAEDQMLRCSLNVGIAPDAPGYGQFVAQSIKVMMVSCQKNILVLFTSYTSLNGVYDELRKMKELTENGLVLAQNISGSRPVVLEKFKNSRNAVLLGTDSFWEGIDAPGESCEIVCIPRLPFQVPTHPLAQAVAAQYQALNGESFFSYSVPEAVIRFRQGAGRLIRSSSDRGALIVLDNRVVTKGYGKVFTRSIKGPFENFESVESLVEKMVFFFEE